MAKKSASGESSDVNAPQNSFQQAVEPAKRFAQDSYRLVKRCTKPDAKEFKKIALATTVGFLVMGFLGFFVKLVHIPSQTNRQHRRLRPHLTTTIVHRGVVQTEACSVMMERSSGIGEARSVRPARSTDAVTAEPLDSRCSPPSFFRCLSFFCLCPAVNNIIVGQ